MVSRKTNQRPAVKTTKVKKNCKSVKWFVILPCVFILIASLTFAAFVLTREQAVEVTPASEPEMPEIEPEPELPEAVGLQSVVERWAAGLSGNKSVYIYDLERDEVAAEYNIKEDYNTASLYKLFVVYEGYRRVEKGEWNGNERIVGGYTILDCLDLAVRESYSPCAEQFWAMIGHDALDEIIESEWKIVNSDISVLVSNVVDIYKMLRRFYEHPDFSDEKMVARMWDSFLNQPETTYDWRQGLPSGFSSDVEVYNKVGWAWNADQGYWNIYHDAAIVHFKEKDRTFIVVVMTNYIDYPNIRNLARLIETEVNKY